MVARMVSCLVLNSEASMVVRKAKLLVASTVVNLVDV